MEKLEVESEEDRQLRIRSALEKLNQATNTPLSTSNGLDVSSIGQKVGPHAIAPPTDLLARVQAFLPQLEAANAALAEQAAQDPSAVDIENVDPHADQIIEMNLGLGVFEERRSRRRASNEGSNAAASQEGEDESDSADDKDSDSDGMHSSSDLESDSDSSDCSSDSIISRSSSSDEDASHSSSSSGSVVLPRIIRPIPKRRQPAQSTAVGTNEDPSFTPRRPEIVVLASTTTSNAVDVPTEMAEDE
ncbi:hypothetical protein HGRIS_013665 [Hohenbuehelia grisea]|uniref:NET domain-containing protein n=1 Tax=Hohenbuehelia grisea TaxID=104357 RepID=A0ABR3IW74_9AGAR